MKAVKVLLSVMLVAVVFSNQSCKKYEDGPAVSLRSKKARVVNEWVVKKIYENGSEQDMTGLTLWLDFNDDWTGRSYVKYSLNGDSESEDEQFDWEFNSDKTKVIIDYKDKDIDNDELVILKLYEDEFWFKETDDKGNEWEYHLEPR